jgi:iron complex outermembrane receptor protein
MKTLHTLALALGCSSALAQTSPSVLITGNPLGRQSAAQAASVLTGDALLQRRAGTLGETLDGLPGVAGSGFGPNSNRPVIRGLDGDRVRLLDNGGASPATQSNLSFDHAVAVDPLVVERLEVLRGPAALLYGGNATGGVVNAIDNRIPRAPLPKAWAACRSAPGWCRARTCRRAGAGRRCRRPGLACRRLWPPGR